MSSSDRDSDDDYNTPRFRGGWSFRRAYEEFRKKEASNLFIGEEVRSQEDEQGPPSPAGDTRERAPAPCPVVRNPADRIDFMAVPRTVEPSEEVAKDRSTSRPSAGEHQDSRSGVSLMTSGSLELDMGSFLKDVGGNAIPQLMSENADLRRKCTLLEDKVRGLEADLMRLRSCLPSVSGPCNPVGRARDVGPRERDPTASFVKHWKRLNAT